MFTRVQRRMLKEAVISLHRVASQSLKARRFWMDQPEDFDMLADAVSAINQSDVLPWPDRCCLIGSYGCVADRWANDQPVDEMRIVYRPLEDELPKELLESTPRFMGSTVRIVGGHLIVNTLAGRDRNIIDCEHEAIFLLRVEYSSRELLEAAVADDSLERQLRADAAHGRFSKDIDSVISFCNNFERRCLPPRGVRMWQQAWIEEGKGWRFGAASQVLCALAAAACPCGYKVYATFAKGFGPTPVAGGVEGAVVTCHVGYDRLYRMITANGGTPPEVKPHERRGHYRYLWKASGIDRNSLPAAASERLAMAFRHNVRKVYVHPAWIGQTDFHDDGIDWHIATGESEEEQ